MSVEFGKRISSHTPSPLYMPLDMKELLTENVPVFTDDA
jgi:hypothetical protein